LTSALGEKSKHRTERYRAPIDSIKEVDLEIKAEKINKATCSEQNAGHVSATLD
jgi:hypothetical protein